MQLSCSISSIPVRLMLQHNLTQGIRLGEVMETIKLLAVAELCLYASKGVVMSPQQGCSSLEGSSPLGSEVVLCFLILGSSSKLIFPSKYASAKLLRLSCVLIIILSCIYTAINVVFYPT